MPIYEYVCKSCEHRFELLVRASTVPECPACKGRKLQRQLSVFAVNSSSGSGSARLPESCHGCNQAGTPACAMRQSA